MARELKYYGKKSQTGLSIVAKIYDNEGDKIGDDVNSTEVPNTSIYVANMPLIDAGVYLIRFYDGEILLGQGEIDWDGTKETTNTSSRNDIKNHVTAINFAN